MTQLSDALDLAAQGRHRERLCQISLPATKRLSAFSGTDRQIIHFHTMMESPLADLDLERAIALRWTLRDILANRLKLSPLRDDDLRTLIDLGLVEMRDDALVVTQAGIAALE